MTDAALAPWAVDAGRLCRDGEVVRVMRHVPGRRVTTLVQTSQGQAILKVFSSPRARGGNRRLRAFASTAAAGIVPRSLGTVNGHVGLVEFVDGIILATLSGTPFVNAAVLSGQALRRIHDSGAQLDRQWTVDDEIDQLHKSAGESTRAAVVDAAARWRARATGPLVPSHRDCYPSQAVLAPAGVRFIDLDDCAMAPAGLDVGNFVAHILKDAAVGARSARSAKLAVDAFVTGYRGAPAELDCWKMLSLARLAALAETRHGDLEQARLLMEMLA